MGVGAQVLHLAARGVPQTVIAKAVGVSPQRVGQIVHKAGVVPPRKDKTHHERRERVMEAHARGMTTREIEAATGVIFSVISQWLSEWGVAPNKPARRSKWEQPLRKCAEQGMTVGEAAAHLGIPASSVSRAKNVFGIELRDGRRG